MDKKNPNSDLVNLVEKLLNEALKKDKKKRGKNKGKPHGKEKMADKDYDGDGKVESSKDEYFGSRDKAIKKNMGKDKKEIVSKKKKKQLDEGRIIGNEQLIYGGFPRIINVLLTEGEESESTAPRTIRGELEIHLGTLSNFGQQLHRTKHPNGEKFGKALGAFTDGNFDMADELISMGADPEAVGNYIKIRTSPEYKAYSDKVLGDITPESMGYGSPGSGSRQTFD